MSDVSRKDFLNFVSYLEKEGYVLITEGNTMYIEIVNPEFNLERFEGKLSVEAMTCINKYDLKLEFEFGEAREISKNKFRIPIFIKGEGAGWGSYEVDI